MAPTAVERFLAPTAVERLLAPTAVERFFMERLRIPNDEELP